MVAQLIRIAASLYEKMPYRINYKNRMPPNESTRKSSF